jgi:hypothetical protein
MMGLAVDRLPALEIGFELRQTNADSHYVCLEYPAFFCKNAVFEFGNYH